MKLTKLIEIVGGDVLNKPFEYEDRVIKHGFSADLMSDALMVLRTADMDISENSILITGLVTNQSIRTAEVLDVPIILFVRDKMPTDKVLELATESEILIIKTKLSMYCACGRLYKEGLKGYRDVEV